MVTDSTMNQYYCMHDRWAMMAPHDSLLPVYGNHIELVDLGTFYNGVGISLHPLPVFRDKAMHPAGPPAA